MQLQVYKMKEKKKIDVLCFTHVPCEIHSTANTYSIVSRIILINVDLYVRLTLVADIS